MPLLVPIRMLIRWLRPTSSHPSMTTHRRLVLEGAVAQRLLDSFEAPHRSVQEFACARTKARGIDAIYAMQESAGRMR
eukprot:2128441-Pleurochrysis_carterae.AAC.1